MRKYRVFVAGFRKFTVVVVVGNDRVVNVLPHGMLLCSKGQSPAAADLPLMVAVIKPEGYSLPLPEQRNT